MWCIDKAKAMDRHYYFYFGFEFTFIVFHPSHGTKPAYRSDNYEEDVIQYPTFCIYNNIDRYYGMKSTAVKTFLF